MWGLLASIVATGAGAAPAATDFGIRVVGAPAYEATSPRSSVLQETSSSGSLLAPAKAIGARWGRVTSTYRTAAHNRQVGGVRNSWHLSGRAIDIARRPGVSHWQIAAALRAAGYFLIESLDEGDHSHFAFGSAASSLTAAHPSRGLPRVLVAAAEPKGGEVTDWGIVTISNRRGGGLSRR